MKKGLLGMLLVACMLLSCVCVYAGSIADDDSMEEVGNGTLNQEIKAKLTTELLEIMQMSIDTPIAVCVWFEDLDKENVLASMPAELSQGVKARSTDTNFNLQTYLIEKRSYFTDAYASYNYEIIDSILI